MTHDHYDNSYISDILRTVSTIAVVGASANDVRPSYFVMKYMLAKGYRIIPVNPGQAGREILEQTTYARLADIPEPIDMVDIFRASDAVPAVIDEVLALSPLPKVVWMQLTVRHDEAAARAEAAGIRVVMDRCPKIEYARLSGEIGWNGVNSGVLSSRKPVMRAGMQSYGLRGKPGGAGDGES
ncbi:CoA-binding protein [Hoeflea olei]|uniref:CoA-binding protein n=1 Tax=Hoeflea olei TaxID=1480615 RepID=A0A1C1YTH9_9HYPH|nr:CoA-binding protein [Hoeflea olei]OCW56831.1 CoA-binding protein [Hoeflea olei]